MADDMDLGVPAGGPAGAAGGPAQPGAEQAAGAAALAGAALAGVAAGAGADGDGDEAELADEDMGEGPFYTGVPKSYVDNNTKVLVGVKDCLQALTTNLNALAQTGALGRGFGRADRQGGGRGKRRFLRGNGKKRGGNGGGHGGNGGGNGGGRGGPVHAAGISKAPAPANLICWKCKQPGHRRENCPDLAKNAGKGATRVS